MTRPASRERAASQSENSNKLVTRSSCIKVLGLRSCSRSVLFVSRLNHRLLPPGPADGPRTPRRGPSHVLGKPVSRTLSTVSLEPISSCPQMLKGGT